MFIRFKDFLYQRKMAKQRAKRGYSDDMVWGLDGWLSKEFPKMIIHLRDKKVGAPHLKFEEIGHFPLDWLIPEIERIKQKKDYNPDYKDNDFDLHEIFDRWDIILSRIAFCLIESNEDTCSIENEYSEEFIDAILGSNHGMQETETFSDWWDRRFEKEEDGNYLMKLNEPDSILEKKYTDRQEEILQYREDRKDEAFDLLKKYFYALWD